MTAIEQFKQAAAAWQQDEIYLALLQARKASDEDAELQEAISDFTMRRAELNAEAEKPSPDNARVEELNANIVDLYSRIVQNPNMQAFDAARSGVQDFVSYVNDILNAAIAGEDPLLVEPAEKNAGCSPDGCSSCAGCG